MEQDCGTPVPDAAVNGGAAPAQAPRAGSSAAPSEDEWEDVSELLTQAASDMSVGEMVHLDTFSLYAAMSAIELMQPKMDVGCGEVRNVADVELPATLSDGDVISVMDELLACQATWMMAHTLPQTVFSCVYVQRLDEVPRPELASFIRVLLACMSIVRTVVSAEQISCEEDFITYTFGFKLPVLTEPTVSKIVREALQALKASSPDTEKGAESRRCLAARLHFLQALHSAILALAARDCKRYDQAGVFVELAKSQLAVIRDSWRDFQTDATQALFDASINRHLLANTPPRTAPVLSKEEAFGVLATIVDELGALTTLRPQILPGAPVPAAPDRSVGPGPASSEPNMYYSFHSLIHALCNFSAAFDPCILTRSLLKRLLLPAMHTRSGSLVFGVDECSLNSLLLTDMGLSLAGAPGKITMQVEELAAGAAHIVWSLLRNRGRQRRYLLRSLSEWDRMVLVASRPVIVPGSSGTGNRDDGSVESTTETSLSSESSSLPAQPVKPKPRDMFAGKCAVQLLAHEVSARLLMQHWFLGFECKLYQPSEYATIFFYLGYVATTAANATAALSKRAPEGAELHPCRVALYMMDEARLWICRATFSLLEALELGREWAYKWRGARQYHRNIPGQDHSVAKNDADGDNDCYQEEDARFDSDELRYEQRFGRIGRLLTGPQFVSYPTFLSLLKLQRDSLMAKKPNGLDEVSIRLSDAASGFKVAREALERAQRAAKSCAWEPVAKEALQLARVAVSNSILIPRLQKMHEEELRREGSVKTDEHKPTSPLAVQFVFEQHRHFPVVSLGPA